MFCSACGYDLGESREVQFCPRCGAKIGVNAGTAPENVSAQASPGSGKSSMKTGEGGKKELLAFGAAIAVACIAAGWLLLPRQTVKMKGAVMELVPREAGKIAPSEFAGRMDLKMIKIPEGVTEIGSSGLSGCYNLTSVELPEGVTEIGDDAFSGCYNLTSVELPEGVTKIGYGTFYNCYNLASIEIPDGVTEIGEYAFSNCYNLTSIEIPEGVMTINWDCFRGCKNLEIVRVPLGFKSGWDSKIDERMQSDDQNMRDFWKWLDEIIIFY